MPAIITRGAASARGFGWTGGGASVPGAPTIGTATATGATTATVTFTQPVSNGGSPITSYTATSSPSGITGTLSQAGSGTITVSGLTASTSYTFTVKATNAIGQSAASAASNSITTQITPSQQAYQSCGSYSWVAPAGVTKVSVVAVGNGLGGCTSGGAGGGLGYKNNYTVIPGNSYTVVAGNPSYFVLAATVSGGSNPRVYTGDGGALGATANTGGGGQFGGGGAGGYSAAGNSGTGGAAASGSTTASAIYNASNKGWSGGGGVGILGSGSAGTANTAQGGSPNGAGGTAGNVGIAGFCYMCVCCIPGYYYYGIGGNGGNFGGGGGGFVTAQLGAAGLGGPGAVRIIWPGCARSFPSTRTGDE